MLCWCAAAHTASYSLAAQRLFTPILVLKWNSDVVFSSNIAAAHSKAGGTACFRDASAVLWCAWRHIRGKGFFNAGENNKALVFTHVNYSVNEHVVNDTITAISYIGATIDSYIDATI